MDINPYADFGRIVPAVGAIFPAPATYDFVFDTPAGAKPGKFTFRFWVNDLDPADGPSAHPHDPCQAA